MIKTDRLIIREFNMKDADAIFRLSQEEGLRKWLPDQVYKNLEDAKDSVNFLMSNYEIGQFPYVLAIVKKIDGQVIGHVGLSSIDKGIEIGYAIGEKYQKNGYAKEAVNAFIEWSKHAFDLKRIFGVIDKNNVASMRLLESVGFIKEDECNNKIYYFI